MSLGAPFKISEVRKAIQYAVSKNVLIFCAAGNAGNTKEVFYPANYPETIAIGAIDQKFKRADFSNTGSNLDFMAPGVDIFSTVPDSWYATFSGTSMACPFAVGVASLLISYSKKRKIKNHIQTADECRRLFKEYTVPIESDNLENSKFFGGFGIIDPRKLHQFIDSHADQSST
jgi:subtilisin family serine protease